MASVTVQVHSSGPVFNGGFERAVDDFCEEAADDIATVGLAMMHNTARFFRNPTGRWESKLVVDRRTDHRVISNNAVYNAWLEGTGSRNHPVTRFRGYRMWRLTGQQLNAVAVPVALQTLGRHIGRMG
jgi:hypothetical protein